MASSCLLSLTPVSHRDIYNMKVIMKSKSQGLFSIKERIQSVSISTFRNISKSFQVPDRSKFIQYYF